MSSTRCALPLPLDELPVSELTLPLLLAQDRVDAGTGFGTHQHREFEIWSYIVDGELEHKDSMGNLEIMRRGDVQSASPSSSSSSSLSRLD